MSPRLVSCCVKRYFSQQLRENKPLFVTTPIFYVNASPHIGHLYSAVIADCVQRWHRILHPESNVLFSTGTDEHGLKIQQAAQSNDRNQIAGFCSNVSNTYRGVFDEYNIGYTDFIRTSSAEHIEAVQHFWKKLEANGFIYSAEYSGWYSVPDESFLSELQVADKTLGNGDKIKVSIESGHEVEWTQETNYLFRLSALQSRLLDWCKQNESLVKPKKFYDILIGWISDRLPDVSISRPTSRVHWAIPVPPQDISTELPQTVYVWLDAIVNYLTVAGYPDIKSNKFQTNWPPSLHVLGKDILKFHGIYWPAFLMAADLPLPKQLLCHSHWTVENEKMSKSKGNVISPQECTTKFTSDGFRYFLIREGVPHSDSNYSEVKVTRILNSELADTYGNLLSRCCAPTLNPKQVFPALDQNELESLLKEVPVTKQLIDKVEALPDIVREHYNNFHFYKGIDAIIGTLHTSNLFFETTKPWELRKHEHLECRLNTSIHLILETLRVCSILLQPVLPQLTDRLLTKIGVVNRSWDSIKPFSWNKQQQFMCKALLANGSNVLFQRIKIQTNVQQIKKKT